jgi:hypothetical protein
MICAPASYLSVGDPHSLISKIKQQDLLDAEMFLFQGDHKRRARMSILTPTEPVENRLLAALSHKEYERLLPSLQRISFSFGEVVYEFGGHLDYVFFPTLKPTLP